MIAPSWEERQEREEVQSISLSDFLSCGRDSCDMWWDYFYHLLPDLLIF